jgi:hypothetical protein
MKKTLLASVVAICTMIGAQTAAHAALYDFTFSGPSFGTSQINTVIGTLTTSGAAANNFSGQAITGITGTYDGAAITGLSGFQGSDNLFFYGSGSGVVLANDGLTSSGAGVFVDHNGLSFSTASASANLYTSDGAYVFQDSNGVTVFGNGTFTASAASTPVPEPGSLALLGTGLLGLLLVAKRKRVHI